MLELGLSTDEFRETYQERQRWHRPSAWSGEAFRWSELDELLYLIEPRAPVFQLFNHGVLPEKLYTFQSVEFGAVRLRLNKHCFYAHLREGATLVLNRLENYSLRARRLCKEIGRFTDRPAFGNAYLSLCGDGTFGRHWDTHDVFAV